MDTDTVYFKIDSRLCRATNLRGDYGRVEITCERANIPFKTSQWDAIYRLANGEYEICDQFQAHKEWKENR